MISSEDISDNALISRFVKGCAKKRPSKPRYDSTWDVDPVLKELEKWFPLNSLDMKTLSYKLVVLLALGTSHRLQTLASIKVDNIVETQCGIEIRIPDHIKTSKKGKPQPVLKLPKFEDRPGLCICHTLLYYLEQTRELRTNEKHLLISLNKPHKAVKEDTIGRWIKTSLEKLGVDKRFTAHSTRHASTSKAATKGVSMMEIKRVAGWSQSSRVFADFYQLPITIQENNFAKAVLLPDETASV